MSGGTRAAGCERMAPMNNGEPARDDERKVTR
jgi:hypothetical protein